ncbi:MAG: HIT family protein [Candidatus Methanoperedens sp.]|nr:HIT family protein [Candidatus Methanoperedens sp.]MCE8424356.1 HIT family protein [Candidatus Methanoperedens sp.]
MKKCLFCNIEIKSIVLENQLFYVIFDKYPVNPGHLLIISRRHIPDLFDLNETEFNHLYEIINKAKKMLDLKYKPDGYNIGANCGEVAGQTILHFHLHIIPRYNSDVEDPRGGVRNLKKPVECY